MPWLFLSVAVILWGLAPVKAFLNGGPSGFAAYRSGAKPVVSRVLSPTWDVPLFHRLVFRDYPVSSPRRSIARGFRTRRIATDAPKPRSFTLNWLSATGTAILLAALASAVYLRVSVRTARRRRDCRPRAACARRLRRSC